MPLDGLSALLEALRLHDVRYVLIGGVAVRLHGSAYVTEDVDIVYDRAPDNLERLSAALRDARPQLRLFPPEKLPFRLDAKTLATGMNFTLSTDFGDVDLLGEIAGLGQYPNVSLYAEVLAVGAHRIPVLSIEGLILAKRAAGRPKDMLLLPELESMRELRSEERSGDDNT